MFSEKLKQAMQELDINQSAVCSMTGRSKGSISQYLSGKQVPSVETQREIAASLGLNFDYFDQAKKQSSYPTELETIPRMKVETAAKLLGMNQNTVRKGLQQRVFPWGYAVHTSENGWSYFINAKKFAEHEGVVI